MPITRDTSSMTFLQKLRQREGLFRILIFTFVTILCWIGFSIYLSQKKTKVEPDVRKHTLPLNPSINRAALLEIQSRTVFTEEELNAFPRYQFELGAEQTKIRTEIGGGGAPVEVTSPQESTDEAVAEPVPTETPAVPQATPEPTPATSTQSGEPVTTP